jgi:hypothetical protein
MNEPIKSVLGDHVVAVAKLLQGPNIAVDCPNNCGCNPTCGCESKPGCCENKCSRNDFGASIPSWEEIVVNPAFREIVASLDAEQIKTISDFKALTERVAQAMARRREGAQ